MGKRALDAIWLAILSLACSLMIWHAVQWHSTGMYQEMIHWLQLDRGYITVLYNLGLMLAMGLVLGFLIQTITGLLRHW